MPSHGLPPQFEEMIGRSVLDVDSDQDGFGFSLTGGWVIRIFNRYCLKDGAQAGFDQNELRGETLLAVDFHPDSAAFKFSGGRCLAVDVTDEAFTGPEALVISGPDARVLVDRGER